MNTADTLDHAAGLKPDSAVYAARRLRPRVMQATQDSEDALLWQPVAGFSVAQRLRVAQQACEAVEAFALARHYQQQAQAATRLANSQNEVSSALDDPTVSAAAGSFANTLMQDPRRGERAALQALKEAGLDDAAIVALAQLVGFLSYQTRVVAGLQVLASEGSANAQSEANSTADGVPGDDAQAIRRAAAAAQTVGGANPPASSATPLIQIKGFTNQALGWQSWLNPLRLDVATALQLQVLDESHAQARSSAYYLTLAHQPLMLRHRSSAYNAILYAPAGAARAERELAAMVVSVTNGCVYCTSVHAQRYAQLARRHDTVEQVFANPADAGSTPRERAICRFAQALTLRPQALAAADLADLRAQGLRTAEVLDVLHAAAIFGWANRLMHNLGQAVADS